MTALDEIGDAEFSDRADCPMGGSTDHDTGHVFGFLVGHEVPVRIA